MVAESHCHGPKAISEKVVTTIALRASGISHSLGSQSDSLPGTDGVLFIYLFFSVPLGILNFVHLII